MVGSVYCGTTDHQQGKFYFALVSCSGLKQHPFISSQSAGQNSGHSLTWFSAQDHKRLK